MAIMGGDETKISQKTAKEVVEELKNAGFEEKRSGGHRSGGDHHFFQHPDGRATVVPYTRKKDRIALGTYKAIRRQARLDGKR